MNNNNLAQVWALFSKYDIDGLMVSNPTNIRWLSGFQGSSGRLLITKEKALIATDSRYWIQAQAQSPGFKLVQDSRTDEDLIDLIAESAAHKIGFEADYLSWKDGEKLADIPGIQWQPISGLFDPLRALKRPHEIALMKQAAGITDKVMLQVPKLLKEGITESDLAWQLEKQMREGGASGMAFPIIVAFGSNSALPHHHPSQRSLKKNEIVLVDMGAEVEGYNSDLTRTFFFGEPDQQFKNIYPLVLKAQAAAVQGLHAGASSKNIHNLSFNTISNGGYGDNFPHGVGHAVGLNIHEFPFLSGQRDDITLQAGMVLTLEPGIYLEGWGGVRIEDLILVTETGYEMLSDCPK